MSDRPTNTDEHETDKVAVLDAADERTETETVTVPAAAEQRAPWVASVLHETLVQHSATDGLPVPDAATTARLVAEFGWPAICAAIVDIIVWKHIGFPRMPKPEQKARRAFHKLVKTARSTILKLGDGADYVSECTYRHWDTATVLGLIGLGAGSNVISDRFQWENRLRCRGYNSKSPLEIWEKEEFLRKVDWIFSSFAEERAEKGIRRGDYTGTFRLRSYTATQFRPQVAKAFMDLYATGGVVLDISCGWGDRLAGFYASRAHQYIGGDPNRACFPIYLAQALAYERWLDPRVVPTVERFVTTKGHDAFRVTGTKIVTIVCGPAEDIDWPVQVDLIFSSPPYFNTERYAAEQGPEASADQSWSRYLTIEAWQNGFLYPAVDRARAVLRPGGVLALNIADPTVGEQRNEICDPLMDRLTGQGMLFAGVVAMAVKNRPSPDPEAEGAAKRFAEPVFILTNGPREVRTFEPQDVLALYKKADRHRVEGWLCLIQAGMILDDHLYDADFEAATDLTKKQIERSRYYFRAWKKCGSPGGREVPEVPAGWEELGSIKDGPSVDKQIQAMGVENPRGSKPVAKKEKGVSAIKDATTTLVKSAATDAVTATAVTSAAGPGDRTPPGEHMPGPSGAATAPQCTRHGLLDLLELAHQDAAAARKSEAAVLAALAGADPDEIAALRDQDLDDLPRVRDAVRGREAVETATFDALMRVITEVDERTYETDESTATIIALDRVVEKVSGGAAWINWDGTKPDDDPDHGPEGDTPTVAELVASTPVARLAAASPTRQSTAVTWSPSLDLRCGDTFALLPELGTESIDAFLLSPPYFKAGFDYGVDAANVLGNEATPDLYVANILGLLGTMAVALKRTGVIALNLSDHWSRVGEPGVAGEALGIPERVVSAIVAGAVPGLHFLDRITWVKHHPRHQVGVVGRVSTTTEPILLFCKKPRANYFDPDGGRTPHLPGTVARISGAIAAGMSRDDAHRKWGNPLGAFPGDVWNIPADRAVRHGHPCPFPVVLAERFFRLFAPPGGTVCDPFVGSGSSAVAAARLGLDFVGFDLNPEFIETARKRCEAEMGQVQPAPMTSPASAPRLRNVRGPGSSEPAVRVATSQARPPRGRP